MEKIRVRIMVLYRPIRSEKNPENDRPKAEPLHIRLAHVGEFIPRSKRALRVHAGDDIEARLAAETLVQRKYWEETDCTNEHKLEHCSLLSVLLSFYLCSTRGQNSQDIPIVAHENLASIKHFKSTAPPFNFGGNRPLIAKFPKSICAVTMNPTIRSDQAQP